MGQPFDKLRPSPRYRAGLRHDEENGGGINPPLQQKRTGRECLCHLDPRREQKQQQADPSPPFADNATGFGMTNRRKDDRLKAGYVATEAATS